MTSHFCPSSCAQTMILPNRTWMCSSLWDISSFTWLSITKKLHNKSSQLGWELEQVTNGRATTRSRWATVSWFCATRASTKKWSSAMSVSTQTTSSWFSWFQTPPFACKWNNRCSSFHCRLTCKIHAIFCWWNCSWCSTSTQPTSASTWSRPWSRARSSMQSALCTSVGSGSLSSLSEIFIDFY